MSDVSYEILDLFDQYGSSPEGISALWRREAA